MAKLASDKQVKRRCNASLLKAFHHMRQHNMVLDKKLVNVVLEIVDKEPDHKIHLLC